MKLSIYFFSVLLAFAVHASDNQDLVAALQARALRKPSCGENLSRKPVSAPARILIKALTQQIEKTDLNWLLLEENSLKFKSIRQLARMFDQKDTFAELYNVVLRSASQPQKLERWLNRYLHSAEIEKIEDAQEEVAHSGQTRIHTQKAYALALYATSPTIEEAVRQNGLIVVRVQQRTTEGGVVLGQHYGGDMGYSIYFLLEGDKWSAALPMIRNLYAQEKKAEYIADAIRAGSILAATQVSRGREIFRYGDNAGNLSFVDPQILNWRDKWISSSCTYQSNGETGWIGRVYPFYQTLHFAAAAWVKIFRAKMLSPPHP